MDIFTESAREQLITDAEGKFEWGHHTPPGEVIYAAFSKKGYTRTNASIIVTSQMLNRDASDKTDKLLIYMDKGFDEDINSPIGTCFICVGGIGCADP